jgi:hypothetical protein
MSKGRRRFSPESKFRVALEAVKGQETLSKSAIKYGLHPNTWAALFPLEFRCVLLPGQVDGEAAALA